ncbi:MAG: DIP1984 family protein [Oscillospiraceae bacterium]|nr:DIP1984 family protein [Oscillospiraceae bacterium]
MKLATALAERSALQTRLTELQSRLISNAKVQEGEEPAEDPAALLAEMEEGVARLEELIAKINLVNSRTVSDGVTLTELLAKRDCLKRKLAMLRAFLDSASARVDRFTRTEIRIRSTVPVPQLQKQADDLSKELRELDERIQELNWTTEI